MRAAAIKPRAPAHETMAAPRITDPWSVRPENEQGKHEQRAPPRQLRIGGDEGEHRDEERQRERLRAELPGPRRDEDACGEREQGAARRRAAEPGRDGGAQEREDDEDDIEHESEPQPAERLDLVEDHLGEPLLVDPFAPERNERERLVRGQAVVGDLPARDQGHPAVGDHQLGSDEQEHDGEYRDQRDHQAVPREDAAEVAGGTVDARQTSRLG